MIRCVVAIFLVLATPVMAVQPDEVLDDPILEQRARDLSTGLRCLVCRNESIDESNAPLARDLRLLVRERLVAGDTDEQVIDFLVDRYGEYVLLTPRADGINLVLWLAAPAMLVVAGGVSLAYIRRRRPSAQTNAALTEAEQERLDALLRDGH